jgi:hypothetical protein
MSRTFRNNSRRHGGFRWLFAKDGKGDSKPFPSRFKSNDGKGTWRCRCEEQGGIWKEIYLGGAVQKRMKAKVVFEEEN